MTPDEIVRALAYQQDLAQTLSVAIGREMNASIGRNMKLDHPDVAYLTHVRAHLDQAGAELANALIFAREPQVAARIIDAERAEREKNSHHSDHLAETLTELEDGGAGMSCADVDRASGTQEVAE